MQIKRQNGEAFAKAIQKFDNGIFDVPNIVEIVKYAGQDAKPLLAYLTSLKDIKIEETTDTRDPIELLDIAGYNAYYVNTLEEQNRISIYFEEDEKLCTFQDPERYKQYYIINAVKKNVDSIKRETFKGHEKREDPYGRSVISIQFKEGFISIKNRYNHTVLNPDNTFYSNPDEIIKGLSSALKHHFNVDFSSHKVNLPENFAMMNKKIVHYNYENNNIYFGADFYAKDGNIYPIDKNTEIILDTCILNLQNKTLFDPSKHPEPIPIDNITENDGSLMCVLANELRNKKLEIKKDKNGEHNILANGIPIITAEKGLIKALNLPTTEEIGDSFLRHNRVLRQFNAQNLKKIGNAFLANNNILQTFAAQNLKYIGSNFLEKNELLDNFYAPKLETVGDLFLFYNKALQQLILPNLQSVGDNFLYKNEQLNQFVAQKLKTVGYSFLINNQALQNLELASLESVKSNFLSSNNVLQQLILPNLKNVQNRFLYENQVLQVFEAQQLKNIGNDFLYKNKNLKTLNFPNVEQIGDCFLYNNNALTVLKSSKLSQVGHCFLMKDEALSSIDTNELIKVGQHFLHSCKLKEFSAQKLENADDYFLAGNTALEKLNIPNLAYAGDGFLCFNNTLQFLYLPYIESIGEDFLMRNSVLKVLDAPNLRNTADYCLDANNQYKTNAPALIPEISADRILPTNIKYAMRQNTSNSIKVLTRKTPKIKHVFQKTI